MLWWHLVFSARSGQGLMLGRQAGMCREQVFSLWSRTANLWDILCRAEWTLSFVETCLRSPLKGSKLFYQVALWDHGSASGDHVVWFPVLCHNVLSLSLYDSGSSYLQSQHYLDVPHWAFSRFFRSCQLSDRSALCHGQGFHIYLRIPLSFYRLSQWVHQTWSLLIPVIKHWIFVHLWNLLQTCTRLAFSRDFPCLLTRPPSLIHAFQ